MRGQSRCALLSNATATSGPQTFPLESARAGVQGEWHFIVARLRPIAAPCGSRVTIAPGL